MFTPPPSPLPRDFGVSLNTSQQASTQPSSSLPAPSSPFLSPASARSDSSPSSSSSSLLSPSTSTPSSFSSKPPAYSSPEDAFRNAAAVAHAIALAQPPAGKHRRAASAAQSTKRQPGHSRNSTIAVLAHVPVNAAFGVQSSKKAQGRTMRFVAIVVPLLLVILTLVLRRWSHSAQLHTAPTAHFWARPDMRPPPLLRPRGASTSSSSTSTSTSTSAAASTTSTDTPIGQVPVAPAADADVTLPTPFPQPWDTTQGSFASSSCSSFFTTFTSSKAFRSCRGFGMLYANSHAWAVAAQNATPSAKESGAIDYLNDLVWGTCNTNTAQADCEATMALLNVQLRAQCKDDIEQNNAVAVSALVGVNDWALYRELGCITNPASGSYCYLEALNAAKDDDSYLYSLPLGTDLPNGWTASCSRCSEQVMSTLRDYAANTTLPIYKTYPAAQNVTAAACGSDYALPAQADGARGLVAPTLTLLFATVLAFLLL